MEGRKAKKPKLEPPTAEVKLERVKEEILTEDDDNIVGILSQFEENDARRDEEDEDDPVASDFLDVKVKVKDEPVTIPSLVNKISKTAKTDSSATTVEAWTEGSFTHLEDLSLHALDLISPYDIRFIGNHMAKRTEREIERRLDDNDFRKKYFLFQRLPSFLFEVVFSNERQLKCRSLMLVSEKLVANLVCATVSCMHGTDIEKLSLEYDGKSKYGVNLATLADFISTRSPEKFRSQLQMTADRLEQLFVASRLSFHKYGTSIGHVYGPSKKAKTPVIVKKENSAPIVLNKGELILTEEHSNMLIRIVGAVGKSKWDGVLILLEEIYGPIVNKSSRRVAPEKVAGLIRDYYITKLDPDLATQPFTEGEDKCLLFLHNHFSQSNPGCQWRYISRHMRGRSEQDCKERLLRKSTSVNDLALDNLDLEDIHGDAPALYHYNESYVFGLTIIPQMDRSGMDITSKLQLETRFLVAGTVEEIFLLRCKETALRCFHQGMSTMNFTYNPAKPDTQFETYLKLTFANGLKKNGLLPRSTENFNFCNIKYQGKGIHALMQEVEEERFIVPKEQFMMFNQKEDEKTTGGKRGFASDKIYKNQ